MAKKKKWLLRKVNKLKAILNSLRKREVTMPNNALTAINEIVSFGTNDLKGYGTKYLNRINAVGEQLEYYIKDAVAGSFKLPLSQKPAHYTKIFSYLGNQNNPPDMIIKNGDAFEIKKIESPFASLALNSSPPKDVLRYSDNRITNACRGCESVPWKEKELFYVIGNPEKGILKYLFFIQGTCYAANHDVYDKVHEPLKKEIDSTLDSLNLEKGKTVELGKVKKVDPLGITELRIRGMWNIDNPLSVFKSMCSIKSGAKFYLFALMKKDKFNSFPKEDIRKIESNKALTVSDVKISDPNNPARQIEAKLITYIQK